MTNSNKLTSDVIPCDDMKVNLENAGNFISPKEAEASLNRYFIEAGITDIHDTKLIYGHTFGINKLTELLANIDKHNGMVSTNDEKIKAVRIYYGNSQRHDNDFELNPKDGFFNDLFIMPVLSTGRDLFNVHALREENIILGESRPCPNQCGLTLLEAEKVIK